MTGKTCFDFLIWCALCFEYAYYGVYYQIWLKSGGVCLVKKNARDSSFAEMIFPQHSLIKEKTRPCEQGNWDTWMVLNPWNQV